MIDRPPRRTGSARELAESAFKAATAKPVVAAVPKNAPAIPPGKELVSLRLDRDVLAKFQEDGPGWQERINAALRRAGALDDPAE